MSLLLSVVLIAKNEEQNLARTLASVKPLVADGQGEIIVVDSGSTDRTVEIARSFGAKVFVEPWKGFAAQKNSAIEKATGEWVLSLDADEEVESSLQQQISTALTVPYARLVQMVLEEDKKRDDIVESQMAVGEKLGVEIPNQSEAVGYMIPRKNYFLGRWIRRGGFYPDRKLRLFRRGAACFEDRAVHEDAKIVEPNAVTAELSGALLHHAYPTLEVYLEHMRRYADLGAEMLKDKPRWWLWLNRWLNPPLTFFYNYVVRRGFLDGREGYLLHWNHRRYVGWKYAKALELSRKP